MSGERDAEVGPGAGGPAEPRRSVLLVHASPDGLGGSQTSMLAEAAALRAAGWATPIVHGRPGPLPARIAGGFRAALAEPRLFTTHPGRGTRAALSAVRAFVAEERPTVAHVHLWTNPLLLAHLVRIVPTVVTCHLPVCPNGARFHHADRGICEHAVGGFCLTDGYRRHGCATTADGARYDLPRFAVGLAYARWTLRLLDRCAAVIAPSEWQRRMLVQDGVRASRITVLAPPIARTTTPPAPAGPSDAAPSPDLAAPTTAAPTRPAGRPPVVLVAGRLVGLKGFDHAVRASARVGTPHELHVAGSGPAEAELRALARTLGVVERVRFLGALPPEELRAAAARARVVVVPSLWPETFGMVGPEALLAGTPVAAYVSGGVRDWARPEDGAVPVPTGDVAALAAAIDELLADDGRAGPVGGDGLRARIDPVAHAAALQELYLRAAVGG